MKKTLFFAALLGALGSSHLFAAQTEYSLLTKWESLQKSDPKVTQFEKKSDRLYRFKTTWFPYQGELRVVSVLIYPPSSSEPSRFVEGAIDVTLSGVRDRKDLPRGYWAWADHNTLYYDTQTDAWITADAMDAIQEAAKKKNAWKSCLFSSWVPPILLLLFFLFLVRRIGKRNEERFAKNLQQIDLSLKIAQENQRLAQEQLKALKEIAKLLKGRKK